MLWLPWSTLAALELARVPPSHTSDANVRAMRAAARTLVDRLASRGDVNVDSYRYDPAETLLTMAEALRRLSESTKT
jgi:hypothetical protein